MNGFILVCLLFFGSGSCLLEVPQNNSSFVLTRDVESKEPEVNGQLEAQDKVDEIKEMLEKIYNSGLDKKVNDMSEKLDRMYKFGLNWHTSCASLFNAGYVKSGVYTIRPGLTPVQTYCDMDTDNGGWTVIQRRTSKLVDFYRTWAEYQQFFGDVDRNYWLGLDAIHQLTKHRHVELYVKLQDFDQVWYFAKYSHFGVESEVSNYKLNVYGYSGTAGDSLAYHNGKPFSTKDRDNAVFKCSQDLKGAWWYHGCGHSNLNAVYNNMETTGVTTNFWYHIKSSQESLKSTIMMIRPADFKP